MKKGEHQLTELQLDILGVIWKNKRATVVEVVEGLAPRRIARKTVATIMSRLEQHGILTHNVEGREYVYRALVTRAQVRRSLLRSIIDRLFDGSAHALASFALEEAGTKKHR
ncbi:MAG TPA: BlaI/MecI/CopY family transcriptional regulator [Gemmatimonadaceae bacterium]|nr:BlaI/MecI/CopY family transcriptional regulator [Gemmatimonadaceae bacterium]